MPGHCGENVFAQTDKKVGRRLRGTPVREQNLQAVARDRGRTVPFEEAEYIHAALRPTSLPSRLIFSASASISISSHINLRAASKYAQAAALSGLLNVTGEPRFEARNTSSFSGMMPSSGV